jgi:hypothetical protein
MIAHLAGATRVAIDTAAFIYLLEEHPVFGPIVEPLFEALDSVHTRVHRRPQVSGLPPSSDRQPDKSLSR